MALTFLYRAFCRILELIRLSCREDTDLAIEVVMLRHEVGVLRRQIQLTAASRPLLQLEVDGSRSEPPGTGREATQVTATNRPASRPELFCRSDVGIFVDSLRWARGDLNPHILSDTGT